MAAAWRDRSIVGCKGIPDDVDVLLLCCFWSVQDVIEPSSSTPAVDPNQAIAGLPGVDPNDPSVQEAVKNLQKGDKKDGDKK